MEAVGLAASIITLVGVASVTGSALSKIQGLRGTPLYVVNTRNAVIDFKATLGYVQYCLDDLGDAATDDMKVEIGRHIKRAQTTMQNFKNYLENEVLREGDGFAGNENLKLRRRAKWREIIGEGQPRFDALQLELDQIKHSITLTLSASSLRAMTKHFTSIQRIVLLRSDGVSESPSQSGSNANTATRLENIITRSNTYNYPRSDGPRTLPLSELAADLARRNSLNLVNTAQQSNTYIKIETKLVSQTCQRRCPCQCHIQVQGGTPRWLQGLVGAAFYNFAGTPLLNHQSCNFRNCGKQAHGSGSARFQYIFPAWLFPLGIEFTASWRALGGIGGSWTFKIPRAIDNYPAINRLNHVASSGGTMRDFQRTMDVYKIRAIDYFSLFGHVSICSMTLRYLRTDISLFLIEAGADVSFRGSSGMTLGEEFWLKQVGDRSLDDLQDHPKLQEARDGLKLSPAHELAIANRIEDLAHLLILDPACVLLQDHYGCTPLHWAARRAHLEVVVLLLDAGAHINAVCKQGRSVLSWAVDSSSVTCCKMLLDAGADVEILDNNMRNVLLQAMDSNSDSGEIANLLLDTSINVNHQEAPELTSLILAAARGPVLIFERLLHLGADIEAQDIYGETAIFHAVHHNNHSVSKLLCNRKVVLNRKSTSGMTVLHYAALCGDTQTMCILKEARIEGLPMDTRAIKDYWHYFALRDSVFVGQRAPIKEEESAFIDLLCSVAPSDAELETENSRRVPGAFPVKDVDQEDKEEDDSESGGVNHGSKDWGSDEDPEDNADESEDYANRGKCKEKDITQTMQKNGPEQNRSRPIAVDQRNATRLWHKIRTPPSGFPTA